MESSFFSKKLIQETIDVFKEEDGILLSEEEAIEILESLASLVLALSKKRAVPAGASAPGEPP